MFNDEIQSKAYAQVLTSPHYGVPLSDPSNSDQPEIGDLGYVHNGRYHKLFTAALPDPKFRPYKPLEPFRKGSRSLSMSEKNPFESDLPDIVYFPHMLSNLIPYWENSMLWNYRYSLPREANSGSSRSKMFRAVEAGISLKTPPAWGYVSNHKIWSRLVGENCREWVDWAEAHAPREAVEDGIVFVTGFVKAARDWDTYFRVRGYPSRDSVHEETHAAYQCPCGSSPRFRHSVACDDFKMKKEDRTLNQVMFLRYYKLKRRPRGSFPMTLERHQSLSMHQPHFSRDFKGYVHLSSSDLSSSEKFFGDSLQSEDPETLYKHPVDWTIDYVFENSSSETDIAFVSDHQIFKICRICDTQPLVQHICNAEIRGKAWNTMNFSFYLRYHRPRIASFNGASTIDTNSDPLSSYLCHVPGYKSLRTVFVSATTPKTPIPRSISSPLPLNALFKVSVISPKPRSEKQLSSAKPLVEMRETLSGPIFRTLRTEDSFV